MIRQSASGVLSAERIRRLSQLVKLLGTGPKTRKLLMRRLHVDTRSFYRDFERLRSLGVPMEMHDGRYVLLEPVAKSLSRLPFPDPCLSVQEAILLARGRSSAHKKLRRQLAGLLPTTTRH